MQDLKVQTIVIPQETLDEYRRLMTASKVDYGKHDIERYSIIEQWTANYGDGFEIDLKVCSGAHPDPLWCEAVLFHYGHELVCSEVEDELAGTWQLESGGTRYHLEVNAH